MARTALAVVGTALATHPKLRAAAPVPPHPPQMMNV